MAFEEAFQPKARFAPKASTTMNRGALMWRALASLAMTLVTCTTCALAQTNGLQSPAARDSPAVRTLMSTAIGLEPHAEMHWPKVLDALSLAAEAAQLSNTLLENWLLEASDSPLPAPQPIGDALAAGNGRQTGLDETAHTRWTTAFKRHLQARLPTAPVSLPDEIQHLRAQLTQREPGLWTLSDREGIARGMFLWLEVTNHWTWPFPGAEFELRAARTPQSPALVFRCLSPYGAQSRAIPGGATVGYLCRLKDAAPANLDLVKIGPWLQLAVSGGLWQTSPAKLATQSQRNQIVRVLADTPTPLTYAWLNANAMSCVQRGNCPPEAEARKPSQAATALPVPKASAWQRAGTFAALAAGAVVYLLVARWLGPWLASLALAAIGLTMTAPMAASLLQQNNADLWGGFLVIPLSAVLLCAPVLLAVAAAAAYKTGVRLIGDAAYRAQFVSGAAVLLMLLALEMLINLLRNGF